MSDMSAIIKTTTSVSESGVVFAGFNQVALVIDIPEEDAIIDKDQRYKKYLNLSDLSKDFNDSTIEYKKAYSFFNQKESPAELFLLGMADDEDIDTAIEDFIQKGGGAYFLATTLTGEDKLKEIADKVEVNPQRLRFVISSNAANILDDGATDDIATYIKTKQHQKTNVIYHNKTDEFADTSILGRIYSIDEGESWENRTLKGLAVDNLTATHKQVLTDKRCGYVVDIQDNAVTKNILAGNGWFADIKRGIDYIDHAIDLRIVDIMLDADMPKNDTTLLKIKGAVVEVMDEGAKRNIVDKSTLEINIPLAADLPGGRDIILEDLYIFDYLHSIHALKIKGTVTI